MTLPANALLAFSNQEGLAVMPSGYYMHSIRPPSQLILFEKAGIIEFMELRRKPNPDWFDNYIRDLVRRSYGS